MVDMKSILFNSEMVQAILDGRKTVTRRVVKFKQGQNSRWTGYIPDGPVLYGSNNIPAAKAPYRPGDILYVRETWQEKRGGGYLYKADTINSFDLFITPDGRVVSEIPWRPSIHMPKEAARLFLRVTDVRVERLRDISVSSAMDEGFIDWNDFVKGWDNTIPKHPNKFKRYPYYWADNPWVWVIEFERCDGPERKE